MPAIADEVTLYMVRRRATQWLSCMAGLSPIFIEFYPDTAYFLNKPSASPPVLTISRPTTPTKTQRTKPEP